ncbi:MAG: UPF0182 family protein, partial [Actinomycetes bacterium]|nr:UPF0182 family protein [Actinomycetes bacterium]
MMKKILIGMGAVLVVAVLGVVAALLWTEYSWFAASGFTGVFTVSWVSRAVCAGVFIVVTYALFLATLLSVRRRIRPQKSRAVSLSTHALAVLLAVLASLQISTQWQTFRLAVSGHSFGWTEPFTGLDASFFVFVMPAAERLISWLLSLVVLEGIWIGLLIVMFPRGKTKSDKARSDGVVGDKAKSDGTKVGEPGMSAITGSTQFVWPYVRPLLAALFAVIGLNLALSAFGLLYSQAGLFPGLSAVDAWVRFPGLLCAGAGAGLVALTILVCGGRSTTRKGRDGRGRLRRAPFVVGGVWAVASVLTLSVAPAVVSALRVTPNEMTAEAPWVQHAIDGTQAAFGLDQVATVDYPVDDAAVGDSAAAASDVTATGAGTAAATATETGAAAGAATGTATAELSSARIWTPSSLKQAFQQLETVRPYYQLSSIQPDRYVVNGREQEVLVAAREINVGGLPKSARTWVNRHLVYTHGYGLSVASATEVDEGGFPVFWVGDVPPTLSSEVATASPALETNEPRIYFGQQKSDWALVGTKLDEFDHDDGDKNASSRYADGLQESGGGNDRDGATAGTGTGIPLDSFAARLAWSLRLRSKNLLLSGYVTSDSQLLTVRGVRSRVAKLAPWLQLDSKAYPALVDGRIVWILDGYTSTDHFPFAAALSGNGANGGDNYLRNSVKAVIDAYTGKVTLYAFGDDPIRDAWAAIYPHTVTPQSEVSEALAAHFRYPTRLFKAQARIYATYHIDAPEVFYNKEDLWGQFSAPGKSSGTLAPSYHLLTLPDDTTATYDLVLPYSIPKKDNMISLLTASSDPASYGQLTALRLPRE